jgi:hypothetical protein
MARSNAKLCATTHQAELVAAAMNASGIGWRPDPNFGVADSEGNAQDFGRRIGGIAPSSGIVERYRRAGFDIPKQRRHVSTGRRDPVIPLLWPRVCDRDSSILLCVGFLVNLRIEGAAQPF